MHLQKHAFDDIVRKGVTKNFGTKIDESMHGEIRDFYLERTNFKNVAPQVYLSSVPSRFTTDLKCNSDTEIHSPRYSNSIHPRPTGLSG